MSAALSDAKATSVDTSGAESEALRVISQCFESHAAEEVGVSFNGGKDSVVMLWLLHDAIGVDKLRALKLFMFAEADEFEEMVAFRDAVLASLGLTLRTMPQELGIKGGLQRLHDDDGVRAVFLGTRQDDPDGKYQKSSIEKCTAGWPNVVRYCPVFTWNYAQVWSYILRREVPFCSLYRDGYTSLGSKMSTRRNSHLAVVAGDAVSATSGAEPSLFRPAWELADGAFEREGRVKGKAHV